MAESQQIIVAPKVIDMDRRVDKDDVAAILMARAETAIKQNIKACEGTEKKLQSELGELRKDYQTELQKAADVAAEQTVKLLKEAAAALECKHIAATVDATGADDKRGLLNYSIGVSGCKPRISWNVQADAKLPAAVKANLKAQKGVSDQIQANNVTWIDWRRKLQDLPSMERRAKAAVAEERLKDSDEGQRLLAVLETQLDSGIKLLGIS